MRVVIGVDASPAAATACQFVAQRSWPSETRFSLVSAVAPVVDWTGLAPPAPDAVAGDRATLEAVLDERADELRGRGYSVQTEVEVGRPAELIMRCADDHFADLIVVGNRGLGSFGSAILGSVSAYLVDHASCPVLVARAPSATRMLLATDGTASSLNVPRVLAAWGNAFRGLPVEVLSVAPRDAFVTPWSEPDRDGELVLHEGIAEEVANEMMELGWHAAAVVRSGTPDREIVAAGADWGADLIVTGSRGLGTLRRLIAGSVAHEVLLHSRSSVLVMRGLVPAELRRPVRLATGAPA